MPFIVVKDDVGITRIGDGDENIHSLIEEKIASFRLSRDFDLGHGVGTCRPKPEGGNKGHEAAKRSHIQIEVKAAKRENKMNLRFRREI